MDISAINNSNPNFNGRIITKGPWPKYLKNVFTENPEMKKLASGNSDIVGKLKTKCSIFSYEGKSFTGGYIYKIEIYAKKEKPTLKDKIMKFLGLRPTISLTKNYNGINTTETCIKNKINAKEYSQKLGIKIYFQNLPRLA